MEQCCHSNARTEDEMKRKHAIEKKRLPKILKDEMKTRSLMFKESLRISQGSLSSEQEREKMREVSQLVLDVCIYSNDMKVVSTRCVRLYNLYSQPGNYHRILL